MQQRHEKEQWLLIQLEEAAKLHWAEHVAQKARREAEEKAWEEAERQRVVEKERKRLPYWRGLKDPRLWDLSIRKSLPEMRRYNGPLKRLEGSN